MPNYLKYLLIVVGGSLLFIPFIGHLHLFDWDEINFAECAREMIVTKDYLRAQIDFMPFWEKPPLFIWMQVIAMKLFGVGEFAARLPNACIGVVTLCTIFYAGKKVANEKMAWIWVMLYAASWLPHFYFKSGIIDPTFNLFIFLSCFQIFLIRISTRKTLHAILAGLFLGMAILTKGPVAALVVSLAMIVYLVYHRGLGGYIIKDFVLIGLFAAVPALLWLTTAMVNYGFTYGRWFVTEFLSYQVRLLTTEDSDHGGPFFYHFVVLLIGCFPASAFLFQYARKRNTGNEMLKLFNLWMWILFGVVLILFSIVKTKIVHYSSLCYFPLTWLAAVQVYRLVYEEAILKKTVKVLLYALGILWAVLLIALPVAGVNKKKIIPFIDDPFAVGNLQANVHWCYCECTIGLLYLVAIIFGVWYMRKQIRESVIFLFIIQLAIIQYAIYHFPTKIEAFSQKAAIDFYQSLKLDDVYVHPLGYKSYAHLFYTNKKNTAAADYKLLDGADSLTGKKLAPRVNEAWLLNGNTDKPVYFVCKVQDKPKFAALPQLAILYEKNGFVFFKKK